LGFGFLIIILSGFVAFTLSRNNPDLDKMELGALENFFMPIVSTVAGLIIYLAMGWIIKYKYWLTVSVSISILNLFYGMILFSAR